MSGHWFTESTMNEGVYHAFGIERVLFETKSEYQEIKVYQTKQLGRLLTLDGAAMISEKDEFIYHEVMVHCPLLVQSQTKHVLVIGGGDGGIIRELCRYPSIERIDLVEIDREVVRTCQDYFPNVARSLENSRVHIFYQDGIKFLEDTSREGVKYDLIIIDSTDPVGLAKDLYSNSFYELIHKTLSDEGIFMSQTGTPLFDEFGIRENYRQLGQHFKKVQAICAPILIYPGVHWTFAAASKKWSMQDFKEAKLSEYSTFSDQLKWHNPPWQSCATELPNIYKKKIFGEDF